MRDFIIEAQHFNTGNFYILGSADTAVEAYRWADMYERGGEKGVRVRQYDRVGKLHDVCRPSFERLS